MSMTFLDLSKRARSECDVSGTGPTTVVNQVGKLQRVVDWVSSAYVEIQGRSPKWRWLRKPFTLNTVIGTDNYAYSSATDTEASAAISRFRRWWADDWDRQFTIYLQSAGVSSQRYLNWVPFDYFKRIYRFGPQLLVTGPPIHVSVDDNNKIVLGPNPDAVYVVGGEYQRSAQILAADGDTPEMPADFHMLIVYEAMKKYAGGESAPEVYTRAITEGNRLMRQLEINQLPQFRLAAPLA